MRRAVLIFTISLSRPLAASSQRSASAIFAALARVSHRVATPAARIAVWHIAGESRRKLRGIYSGALRAAFLSGEFIALGQANTILTDWGRSAS